ncbi:hypothetical protein [Massilia aerilata]|uniref:Uncharacterized protein n=1 Tax=Massilia aerilata TaxID=453817 RepID=A0ABW0S053_9BURK
MITITALSAPHGTQTVKADLTSLKTIRRDARGVRPKEAELDRKKLLQLLDSIKPPKQDALSDEAFESIIDAFCTACPHPIQARWLLLDCLDPLSDGELVDRALTMPKASPAE